jgi:hypothetical protein
MHLGEAKFQSVVLLSIEERRALFATSISSRVDDAADDNLERSTWLASVPVLSYTQALHSAHTHRLPFISTENFFIAHGNSYSDTWL